MTIEQFCKTRDITREDIEAALTKAQEAQTAFWDSLRELESLTGADLSIDDRDLENWDIESLIEECTE